MNALKCNRGNVAGEHTLPGRHHIYILRSHNYIYGFVKAEALIDAAATHTLEFDVVVGEHNTVHNIAFAYEIRNKSVLRFIVNIGGRAYLLNNAAVHNHYGIGHGKCFLLVVRYIYKRYAEPLLYGFELALHILAKL